MMWNAFLAYYGTVLASTSQLNRYIVKKKQEHNNNIYNVKLHCIYYCYVLAFFLTYRVAHNYNFIIVCNSVGAV